MQFQNTIFLEHSEVGKVASVVVATERHQLIGLNRQLSHLERLWYNIAFKTQQRKNTAGGYEHQFLGQMEANFSVRYITEIFLILLSIPSSKLEILPSLYCIFYVYVKCLNDPTCTYTSLNFSQGFQRKYTKIRVIK